MNIFRWFRSAVRSTTRNSNTTFRRSSLTVEALENRLVPTTSAVLLPAIYQDLLHRAPDAGAAGYAAQLDNGISPAVVAYEIETAPSNEFRLDVAANDYVALLHRQAAPSELFGWAQQMAAGATQQQVASEIVGSTEYYTLHGNTTLGFLNALYGNALGRPDSEQAWVGAINSGVSRQTVAYEVFTSQEGLLHQVLVDYQQYLDRSGVGDPGALGFALQMARGVPNESIVADLMGSAEYLALHHVPVAYNGGGQPDQTPDNSSANADDDAGAYTYVDPTIDTSEDTGPPVDTTDYSQQYNQDNYDPPADNYSYDPGYASTPDDSGNTSQDYSAYDPWSC